jgi:flavin-dependent dehydrogenase
VLEHTIVKAAVQAGATLWEGCRVQEAILDDGRCVGVRATRDSESLELFAPLVIAADGYHSTIARSFGVRHTFEDSAFAVRAYFETSREQEPIIDLHFDRQIIPGYGWCFPCGPNKLNVGVGMRALEMKRYGVKLDDLMRSFLGSNRWTKERLGERPRMTRMIGAPLPLLPAPRVTLRDGCLFVGDAAGFVDASTGEGIAMAMRTGKMAAEASLAALARGEFSTKALAPYDRAWKKRFAGTLKAAYKIQKSWGDMPIEKHCASMDKVVEYASRKHAFGSFMCDILSGILPKTAAFSPIHIARITLADATQSWRKPRTVPTPPSSGTNVVDEALVRSAG